MTMTEKEQLITAAAGGSNGKKTLSCSQAFRLSSVHGISLKEIGEICNKNGIKITACQLGCFS